MRPWSGSLTVEEAAKLANVRPDWLRDCAVLAGVPKGFGPFINIEGSVYRVTIDADDLALWIQAGNPLDGSYRPADPAPPRRTWWQGVTALWNGRKRRQKNLPAPANTLKIQGDRGVS